MSRVSPKKKQQPGKVEQPAPTASLASESGFIFKILLIVMAGLFIYAPAFHGTWLWDDDQEITANAALPDVQNGLAKIWGGETGADYLPLKSTVQWVLFRFIGVNEKGEVDPTGWHLANVILHLLNAFLIWRLFAKLRIPQAWVGGLLFCIHPILVESVAWVSELKNTLSLPFLLGAMMCYINFDERGRYSDILWAFALFVAAVLCKSAVIMFPVVILLYCWWKRGGFRFADFLHSAPFFLVSALIAWVTIHFQFGRAIGSETIPLGSLATWTGFTSRVAIAGMAMVFYFWKCVVPFGLLPIYPRWDVIPPLGPKPYQFLAWPLIGAVLLILWSQRKAWGRHALFGVGFFLVNLVPVLGFVTMSYMRITWVADHFVYLPVIGLIGLATGGVGALYEWADPYAKKWLLGGGLAVFAVLTISSHNYAGIFAGEEPMWKYTLKRNPDAWQAHSRLGKTMLEKADQNAMRRMQEANDAAFYHIGESVRLRPDLAETHNNYGAMMEKRGNYEEALRQLRMAVERAQDINIYKINLGGLLVRMKRYDEAAEVYQALLKNDPDNPAFLCNYGVALYFVGRNDEAIACFRKALEINPNLTDARQNLEQALQKKAGDPAPEAPPTPAPPQGGGLLDSSTIKLGP